jgi:hypothetical protein
MNTNRVGAKSGAFSATGSRASIRVTARLPALR